MKSPLRFVAGIVAAGVATVAPNPAAGLVEASAPAPPTTVAPPTTTVAPPATTAPPAPPPPPPAPTTTTIPYFRKVEADCKDYPGNAELADKLNDARGDDGSSHLVSLARYCGVLFSDESAQDPDLGRPRSNLEFAVIDKNDPHFSTGYDDVTANDAQRKLVDDASTTEWYRLHPELVPTTTVPATTVPASTSPATTTTTEASDRDDASVTTTTVDSQAPLSAGGSGGSDALLVLGFILLGAGAVVWGVYGVKRPDDSDDAVAPDDIDSGSADSLAD